MLVILATGCTDAQRTHVMDAIRGAGCNLEEIAAGERHVITVLGDLDRLRRVPLEVFPGVQKVVPITPSYNLAGLEHQQEPTVVSVGDVRIGGGGFVVIAGPCAVEDGETLLATARAVNEGGAPILRGGAWKPPTSPY